MFWYSTIGWFQKDYRAVGNTHWVYFRQIVGSKKNRTEGICFSCRLDSDWHRLSSVSLWFSFCFSKAYTFSRQNVNRVQIPRICILFYFKLWRAFKISHSIGWGNIIFWAQKVQFHHKLFQKKEIWLNDGADKGKMTMTEGKSKVL